MLAYGLTEDEAFAPLLSNSQNRNVKIRDLAARLTENLDIAAPRNAAAAQAMDRFPNTVTTRSHGPVHRQGKSLMVAGGPDTATGGEPAAEHVDC